MNLPTPNSHLGFPCLSPVLPVRLIFYGPRRLAPVSVMFQASPEGVWRLVSDGSRGNGRRLSSVDPTGSGLRSSASVCLQVGSFRSMLLFIGGGCCSGALVPWGLSTTTSRLSTATMFARLRRGRGDDGGAPSARSRDCSRC